jgi:hypothetical protein
MIDTGLEVVDDLVASLDYTLRLDDESEELAHGHVHDPGHEH